jgi:uncharacterized membrane protein YqjE
LFGRIATRLLGSVVGWVKRGGSMATNIQSDRSFADLVRQVVADLQEIVRSEVRLAKAEVREEAGKAANAAKMSAMGGVMALYAGGALVLGIIWLLSQYVSNWAAALIVAVVLGVIAAIMLMVGKGRLNEINPKPEKTIDSIKENLQWNKNQTASNETLRPGVNS